jgi:hypothetical protein
MYEFCVNLCHPGSLSLIRHHCIRHVGAPCCNDQVQSTCLTTPQHRPPPHSGTPPSICLPEGCQGLLIKSDRAPRIRRPHCVTLLQAKQVELVGGHLRL